MKKLYTTRAYKRFHKRYVTKCQNQKQRKRNRQKTRLQLNGGIRTTNVEYSSIVAPADFRFINNTKNCAAFFAKLRQRGNVSIKNYKKYKTVSLQHVKLIDLAAVHTLTAICKELACYFIEVKGDFPEDDFCKQYMIDSGFLDNKYDSKGKRFRFQSHTEIMSFETGQGSKLQTKHILNMIEISKKISLSLSDRDYDYTHRIMPVFKEICGNSIEWSESYKKQWFLASRFEKNEVDIAVIDLGQGILQSLERKFINKLQDIFTVKTKLDILRGAFNQKYGSKSKEINRNKGLPSLKVAHECGIIKDLTVITNNVILSFDNNNISSNFASKLNAFKGTIYSFKIDVNCLSANI